jgi:Zn-dependent protease
VPPVLGTSPPGYHQLLMAKFIRIPLPIKMDRLTRVAQLRGTDVYVHWTVFLIAALMLSAVIRRPMVTLVGIVGWLCVMLIHECGHAFAAHRFGSEVDSIDLYPIFGRTYFQAPSSRFAECMIVWGGVFAQAVVAIPVIAFLIGHGYTSLEPVNALLALLGPYSLMVIIFNLLPSRGLDGARAWKLPLFAAKRPPRRSTVMQDRWR